jgi:hypothetical protein
MKLANTCMLALPLAFAFAPARAASEPNLESMVTCQESWLDWKDNPARGKKFGEHLHAAYTAQKDGYLVPKAKAALFGLAVKGVYPESIGMGLGFSVSVAGSFDVSRAAVEKALGKSLVCAADSDEVRACQFELGPNKTVMVVGDTGDTKTALIGCFYFYEK